MSEFLNLYKALWSRRPLTIVVVTLFYALVAVATLFYEDILDVMNATREVKELRSLTAELKDASDQQARVIEILTKRTKYTSFVRYQVFHENWITEENRTNVLRLLEYAAFALEKEDFRHAEKLYREANEIQETLVVPYNLGRLSYLEGYIETAVSYWKTVIARDAGEQYPDIRLYLGIALYELGEDVESQQYFEEYLEFRDIGGSKGPKEE